MPMKHSLGLLAWFGGGLAIAGAISPALADEPPAESSTPIATTRSEVDGIESIIVTAKRYVPTDDETATKSDIPLIETPESVSVITRDQIDLLAFTDTQQAVRYAAGVEGENYGPDLRYDFLTVRGFTPKQYIDGLAAPITTTIYSVGLDLYAFELFDILKGPASVLYGNAPPGGIYNQISRRASSDFGGELGVKYGNNDYREVYGTVTGALTDSLSGRLTALFLDRDADRDFVNSRRFFVAPTFTWKIDPDTSFTGLFYYQHDEVEGDTNGFLPVYGTLLPNPIGQVSPQVNLGDPSGNEYLRNQFAVGWDLTHRFDDAVSFDSNAKVSRYRERTPTGIYGGGGLTNTTDPTQPGYYRTVQQYNFTYAEDVDSFATDNRVNLKFSSGPLDHKMIAGVDYRKVDNDAAYNFLFANTIDLFNPVYLAEPNPTPGYPTPYTNETLKQTGGYIQDQAKLGDLSLLASGRYDAVSIVNALATPETTTDQHKITYRAGLDYVTPQGFAPYISYATSFEPVLGNDSVTGLPFKPSDGKQVEAGVKYDARGLGEGVKLLATGAVYRIRQSNVVNTEPSITPVFGTQTGEVESKGVELEVVGRLYDQLSINLSYTYDETDVLASSTPAEVGSPLPTTPKNKASAFVDYTLKTGPLGGLGFGFGGRYTGGSAGSLPGPFNPVVYYGQPSTLFDAIAHYDTPEWRFALNGSNIFNRIYVARCSGPAGCTYGAGRQVIGTIDRKF
jgi:iron complex outermembrane recepter protein